MKIILTRKNPGKHFFLAIGLFLIPFCFFGQPNIKLDTSFNHTGFTTIILPPASVSTGMVIKVNPVDNKYIVNGYHNPGYAYLRYNRDGVLDTSFNHTGYTEQNSTTENFYYDSNNKFISLFGSAVFSFFRVNQNGTPDSSFGINGTYVVPNSQTYATDAFLMRCTDSSFLLPGSKSGGISITKITKQYKIDSAFGINGKAVVPATELTYGREYSPSDNKFYLGIVSKLPTSSLNNFRVLKFKPSGNLDSAYGSNGVSSILPDTGLNYGIRSMKLLSTGKMLIFGTVSTPTGSNFGFVSRLDVNGKIDSSFGTFGRSFIQAFTGETSSLAVQKDDKLIVAGNNKHNIARLTEDGSPDIEFGTNGVYQPSFTAFGFPFGILLENDTALLITGDAFFSNQDFNITTSKYKLNFQPFVVGVRSKYCFGSNGTGTIINMPMPDTTVIVKLDNVPISVSAAGVFTFSSGAVGQHIIEVDFIKGSNTWKEFIYFTTNAVVVPVIITPDQNMCPNTFTINIVANTPVYWSGNGLQNPSYYTPATTVSFNATGLTGVQNIIAIKDNGACAVARDTMVITIAAPVANAGSDRTICSGATTTIGASPVSGYTYSWTSSPAGFISTAANPTVSPVVTTTYFLTVTNTGCIAKDTVIVNINSAIANAGPDRSICSGSTTIGSPAVGTNIYSWTSNPAGFTSTLANPTVTPAVTTSYFLNVTNGTCISKDTVVVNVGSITAFAGVDKVICPGTSTGIGTVGFGTNIYSWTSNPAGFTSTLANPTVTPAITTSYFLLVTSGTCTARDTVIISLYSPAVANAGPDKFICSGGSTSVVIGTSAIGGNTYLWSPVTGLSSPNIAQPTASPLVTTSYSLLVTNSNGCTASDNVLVSLVTGFTISLPDSLKTVCIGSSVNIGPVSQPGFSYNWTSSPAGFSSTISQPAVTPVITTVYYLTQTNTATGCYANAQVRVIADSCSNGMIQIFPNPVNDILTIQLAANNSEPTYFALVNTLGALVVNKKLMYRTTIDTRNLPAGIYYYSINGENGKHVQTGKLIIHH